MSPLDTFPEEILESILAYVVLSRPAVHWNCTLLVSKRIHRISKPLYFHTIHLRSQAQLRKLLVLALQPNPDLASHIHQVIIDGVWREAGALFDLCSRHASLRVLDMTLDGPSLATVGLWRTRPRNNLRVQYEELDFIEEFCKHLDKLASITHLRIRKSNNVYLTQAKPRRFLSNLAKATIAWKDLVCGSFSFLCFISKCIECIQEFVDLAFRLSDDSGSPHALLPLALLHPLHSPITPGSSTLRPPTVKAGPLTQLTHALSTLPNLHTFVTHLPNVWNENVLRVSQNPALERIVLVDSSRPFFRGASFYGPLSNPGSSSRAPMATYSVKDLYPGPVSAYMSDFSSGIGSTSQHAHGFGNAYNDLNALYAPGYGNPSGFGIQETGHFFSQAKNHPRLCELIRAGFGSGSGG